MALPTLSGLRVSLPQGFLFVLIKRLSRAPVGRLPRRQYAGEASILRQSVLLLVLLPSQSTGLTETTTSPKSPEDVSICCFLTGNGSY